MRTWVRELDRILRGEATRLPSLRSGMIEMPVGGLCAILIFLGMLYGVCMGSFAVIRTWGTAGQADGLRQLLASTLKVPTLFVLTVIVTFPSLYVFNALVGSRLRIGSVLRLLIAALSVMLAVLASFGTIVAFFSFTTTSYPFMVLLNVVVYAVCGLLGLKFLLQTLHRLTIAAWIEETETPPAPAPSASPPSAGADSGTATPADVGSPGMPPPLPSVFPTSYPGPSYLPSEGALDQVGPQPAAGVKTVFRIWILVFGLVGAQMGWMLRPFIGNPNQPFTWFRPRSASFFEGVATAIGKLLGHW